MPRNLSQPPACKRRTIFTRDAKLTVQRFAKGQDAAAPDCEAPGMLTGYALLWNTLSDDRGGYKVRLLPGSANFFDPTMALFHHNFAAVLGNTQNGTLRLIPDEVGVKVEIDLPDTTTGRDAATLVGDGYVQGMSFAMVDAPKFAMVTEGGQKIMNISSFTADEVTVTAIPSFTDTSIELVDDASDTAEDEPPVALPMAASKNLSEKKQHRDAQWWNSQRYKLDAVAEFHGRE